MVSSSRSLWEPDSPKFLSQRLSRAVSVYRFMRFVFPIKFWLIFSGKKNGGHWFGIEWDSYVYILK